MPAAILATNPRHERARLFLRDAQSSKTMYYDEDQASGVLSDDAVRRRRIVNPLVRDEDLDLTINELSRIRGRQVEETARENVDFALMVLRLFEDTVLRSQEITSLLMSGDFLDRTHYLGTVDEAGCPNFYEGTGHRAVCQK